MITYLTTITQVFIAYKDVFSVSYMYFYLPNARNNIWKRLRQGMNLIQYLEKY